MIPKQSLIEKKPAHTLWAFLLALAIAWGIGPVSTLAADFILHVKVDAKKLHQDLSAFRVHCTVGNGAGVFNSSNTIGSGHADIPRPANGIINETVTVAFDAASGKNPADATRFGCHAQLVGPNGAMVMSSPTAPGPDYAKIDISEPNRSGISGTIPH